MTDDILPLLRRFGRALVRVPVLVVVTIYFMIDDVVLAAIRPIVARLAELRIFQRIEAWIEGLSPYATLVLFLVPFLALEPPKILGLILLAKGQLALGGTMLAISHLTSIILVERLFHATKPKLLTIPWFAFVYSKVMALWEWSLGRLKATAAWGIAMGALRRAKAIIRVGAVAIRRRLRPVLASLKAQAIAIGEAIIAKWHR